MRRGDEVEMTVENALDVPTTVHWHGLLVPGESDGGPQQLIDAGRVWKPILKVNQPAATLWYHPHPHHDTGRQIWMGLGGMLIVSDDADARLGLPHAFGIDDLPLILQDRSFGSDGSLDYGPSPLDTVYGARGDTVIVNGAIAPFARVPPGVVRLRLLNAANAQNFELRFRDRRTFSSSRPMPACWPRRCRSRSFASRPPKDSKCWSISRTGNRSCLKPVRTS
jgi:FtsP/CotA-like multicopper oxidase with cupredoxin domain